MFLDAAEQTEEWNRAQRQEYLDASGGDYDPRDEANYPDPRDLAAMAAWDREAGR
jgi:hypothetical protein